MIKFHLQGNFWSHGTEPNCIGLFQKKNKRGSRTYFFWTPAPNPPSPPPHPLGIYFFPLPLEIQRENKAPQNCVRSLGGSKAKNRDPTHSTLLFLGHPLKFHFVFNLTLEIPHAISLIPLEIPYPQPPVWFFSGIAHSPYPAS